MVRARSRKPANLFSSQWNALRTYSTRTNLDVKENKILQFYHRLRFSGIGNISREILPLFKTNLNKKNPIEYYSCDKTLSNLICRVSLE